MLLLLSVTFEHWLSRGYRRYTYALIHSIRSIVQMEELDARNLHLVDHVAAQLKVFIQPAYANQVELGVKKELDKHVLR